MIHTINIEDWQLYRCINCKIVAFGIHQIDRTYVVNRQLRTTSGDIEKVRSSNVYSPIFRIVMFQVEFTDLTKSGNKPSCKCETIFFIYYLFTNFYLNFLDADKPRIRNLQQHMHEVMQQETAVVEERIRQFSEQQYAMLKMQRLRVEQEFHTLCSVINSVPELLVMTSGGGGSVVGDNSPTTTNEGDPMNGANNNNSKSLMETPPATPDNTPMSIGNSPPIGANPNNTGGFFKHRVPNKAKNVSCMRVLHHNFAQ